MHSSAGGQAQKKLRLMRVGLQTDKDRLVS
jgi:hypothetical protein